MPNSGSKTKSFDTPTFGVSTSNRVYTLSDGSRINLTESVFVDRNKTLEEAINWISSQH